MTRSVGALRAAGLLIRLRLRRLINQVESVSRYRLGSPDRKAASRTSPTGWMVSALVGLAMFGGAVNLAHEAMSNMEKALGTVQVRGDDRGGGQRDSAPGKRSPKPIVHRLPAAPGSVLPSAVVQGAALEAALLLVAALMITLLGREIARPEWDLEWLATLPLPLSTLVLSRLLERAVTSAAGLLLLGPFLSVLAWTCGYRWTAPLIGFGLTFGLLFLVATAQTLVDTGLRLTISPPKLRNLQAAISVASLLPLALAMSVAMPGGSFVLGWFSAVPEAIGWLPTGLAVRAVAAADAGSAAFFAGIMMAEILALVAIGFVVLRHQLRNGVVAAGLREAAPRLARSPPPAAVSWIDAATLLSAVQRRELRLLARDRNFMVQTLVLPCVIVGTQIFFTGTEIFAGAVDRPSIVAAIAFGLAAYALMFSAFQTLNAEGNALWMLYCVPHSLESILWQKARLWAAVTAIYPIAVFAVAVAMAGSISLQFIGVATVVLLGVPIFAVVATALGVFGCNPLAQDVQRRVRVTYVYLYMLIASLYGYAIYSDSVWQRAGLTVLTALVAIALWQKARDQFDFLLDPSSSPPSRVSVSDGLIAALLFFVLQAGVGALQIGLSRASAMSGQMLWIAFCTAGAVTYGIMRLVYWRARTTDVPVLIGAGLPWALLQGVVGGAAAALAGLAYFRLVQSMDWFPGLRQAGQLADPTLPLWLAALAIVAAPLFEEFIFRGLIFRGLRRMFGLGVAALASAAIFAVVHPAPSVVPVFIMGLCAALVYERAKMLAAPIMLHAVYNAAIIGGQWSMMQWSQ